MKTAIVLNRSILRSILLLPLMLACGATGVAHADRPVVGAIRWDAWHGDASNVGEVVERALGPLHHHHRLPFFAEELTTFTVRIDGASQEMMDREIAYAAEAGLDYWAFVTYPPDYEMSIGLDLYLSSAHKSDVNFCLNLQGGWLTHDGPGDWPNKVARYVGYFQEPSYQTVQGGRPLVYLFMAADMVGDGKFATWDDAKAAFDTLRAATVAAGMPPPYFAVQWFDPATAKTQMDSLGFDAISSYASVGSMNASPYADLAAHTENWWWETAKGTGASVIPIVTTGWDRRPRIENPHPWESHQEPGVGMEQHYKSPLPRELATHLQAGIDWIAANPTITEANAIIVYAWNENDEGGWLTPSAYEGTSRLDAFQRVLEPRPPVSALGQPLPVTDGLVLHLDADVRAFADGEAVGQWNDLSGQGHHATATGDAQPIFILEAMNRRPVMRFDGDDSLTVGEIRSETGDLHVFVVSQRFAGQIDGGQPYQRLVSTYDDNGTGTDWQAPNWTVTSEYADVGYTYVGTEYPEGLSRAYPPDIRQHRLSSGTHKIAGLAIGSDAANGSSRLKGDIAEVIVFNRALSSAEQEQLEAYLNRKWLTPPAHPPVVMVH